MNHEVKEVNVAARAAELKPAGAKQPILNLMEYAPKPPIEDIHLWRSGIFNAVADRLCDRDMNLIQRAIGMWKWNSGINIPNRRNVFILPDGAMRMSVFMGNERLQMDINIWMYLGEVRIGLRIPKAVFINAPTLQDKLSLAHDGSKCSRFQDEADHVFYDWIFKSGFGDPVIMVQSVNDASLAAMVADGIANVVTHLYMAAMNAILDSGQMVVSPDGVISSKDNSKQMVLQVSNMADQDDVKEATSAIQGMGIKIDQVFPQGQTGAVYLISYKEERESAIRGLLTNLFVTLGGELDIREVEHI